LFTTFIDILVLCTDTLLERMLCNKTFET